MSPRIPTAGETGAPWTRLEVEAIVADYLEMLTAELSGEPVNKAERNRRLQRVLPNRSRGSIEFKHANISAVLVELGFHYVDGYKPRPNVQALLRDVVISRVAEQPQLASLMASAADAPVPVTDAAALPELTLVRPPKIERLAKKVAEGKANPRTPGNPDYLEREASNASLGLAGELSVIQYEHTRLWRAGRRKLADTIEHVSKTQGDGLGYDIVSFEPDGAPRLIEVKTTRGGIQIPFFASKNEVEVSQVEKRRYHLYRVFSFSRAPQLFVLQGALTETCRLQPVVYRGEVA